jgi:tetratricopeptide (TPR) repeat protein
LTEQSLEESIPLYQQALKIDPTYTAAWVDLVYAYSVQAYLSLRPADEGRQLARDATEKALAIDPQYAPAHALLGDIAIYYDRDLAAGARHIERALALEPANPDIIGSAAGLARRLGRLDQAIAIGEYRMVRDPVNNDTYYELATAYFFAGHLDKAIATYIAPT